jgi:hypothetical protein
VASSRFGGPDIANNVEAFTQVASVFENRSGWLLVANGDSSIGLVDTPVARSPDVLVLRLTLQRQGQALSSADLVIVPGLSADLQLPLREGSRVHYRVGTSRRDPARLGLWAQIEPQAGSESLPVLATSVRLRSGEERTAGGMESREGQCELRVGFWQGRRGEGI